MTKLGVFVGENGDWKFFNEIFADLNRYYETDVYEHKEPSLPFLPGRANRLLYNSRIERLLYRNDVCFFEWASELLVPASLTRKHCPIVTRLHSYELYAWAPRVNWDNVDAIILVSQAMKEKFDQLYPTQAHKTTVVYNARPLDTFAPVEREFQLNIGMLGSIHPRKRIYDIILMLYELRQRGYDAKLHIAGGRLHGPDLDEYYVACHRLVEKLELDDAVTFYDHVSDTSGWLHTIDIFVSNSYWEGHQVALVEAMASGCYCLCHVWDGAEEILPPDNLFVSQHELQQKIIEYCSLSDMERDQRRQRMRRITCEKYSVDRQTDAIRRIIEQTVRSYAGNGVH